jgi:hypothetical protein
MTYVGKQNVGGLRDAFASGDAVDIRRKYPVPGRPCQGDRARQRIQRCNAFRAFQDVLGGTAAHNVEDGAQGLTSGQPVTVLSAIAHRQPTQWSEAKQRRSYRPHHPHTTPDSADHIGGVNFVAGAGCPETGGGESADGERAATASEFDRHPATHRITGDVDATHSSCIEKTFRVIGEGSDAGRTVERRPTSMAGRIRRHHIMVTGQQWDDVGPRGSGHHQAMQEKKWLHVSLPRIFTGLVMTVRHR